MPPTAWNHSSKLVLSFQRATSKVRTTNACRIPRLTPSQWRSFRPSEATKDYPKQGLFQPDSPSRPELFDAQPSSTPSHRSWTGVFNRANVLTIIVFFGISMGSGYFAKCVRRHQTEKIVVPDSEEDAQRLAELNETFGEIEIVKLLRQNHHPLEDGTAQPAYQEWTAYEGLRDHSVQGGAGAIINGPLRGSAGLAAQHIMRHPDTGATVVFVNFGHGTTDDNHKVHSGAIALVIDEAMGRDVMNRMIKGSAVTAKLNVHHFAIIRPGHWYCIVTQQVPHHEEDPTKQKYYAHASMYCVDDQPFEKTYSCLEHRKQDPAHPLGAKHVVAKGLFLVPKTFDLEPIPERF